MFVKTLECMGCHGRVEEAGTCPHCAAVLVLPVVCKRHHDTAVQLIAPAAWYCRACADELVRELLPCAV